VADFGIIGLEPSGSAATVYLLVQFNHLKPNGNYIYQPLNYQ
jgi:hypothetical protein